MEILIFVRALIRYWWALLSSAIFTAVGVYASYANKGNAWVFRASLTAASISILGACFLAWRDIYRQLKSLQASISMPLLNVELLRYTWLPERKYDRLIIEIYVLVRLTNVGNAATTIHKYDLWVFDSTEKTFDSAPCKMRRNALALEQQITSEKPLKRGIHVEGWLCFELHPHSIQDCDEKQRYHLDVELIVTDSFSKEHSSGRKKESIPYDRGLPARAKVSTL